MRIAIGSQVSSCAAQHVTGHGGQLHHALFDRARPDLEHHVNRRRHTVDGPESQHAALILFRFRAKFGHAMMQILVIPPGVVAAPSNDTGLQPLPHAGLDVHESRARRR